MRGFVSSLLISLAVADDCSYFWDVGCQSGDATNIPEDWYARSFQTFLPGTEKHLDSYEGLGRIMCYNHIQYDAGKTSATVTARCRQHNSVQSVQYNWNNEGFGDNDSYQVDSSFDGTLSLTVKATDDQGQEFTIEQEALNFVWQGATINQGPEYKDGQKGGIVEMFGWPYADIEKECEFLGQAGWMGVKVFPPQEQVMSNEWPQNGELNPWWFYYQPVSYKLQGRHGSREELRSMIQTCRAAGVRVYADAVVNHMSGGGNDVWDSHRNGSDSWCTYWGAKSSSAGSPYFTHNWTWQVSENTGLTAGMEYPAAAYLAQDFHCDRSLNSWTDPFALNYGWLSGLADLDTESDYVRERIAAYMTDLLSIGFSGFRMDAAKHIQPESIAAILSKLKANLGGGDLPADFMTYLEVLIGGEKDLLLCGDNYYSYGQNFVNYMQEAGLSDSDIYKVKIWESAYPKEFPVCGYWNIPSERFVAQNDCHDDQNPGSSSRDMQDKGSVLVKEKNVPRHRGFEVQLFDRTDGDWQIKNVLSSYSFMNNGAQGIPDGLSDCSACVGDQCNSCSKSMPFSQAYDPNSCGYDCEVNGQWQEGVYTRVHRDMDIINAMRQWQGLSVANSPEEIGLPSNCYSAMAREASFLQE